MGFKRVQVPPLDERMKKTMEKMHLDMKDVRILYKRFCEWDHDKSGSIDLDEFYRSFREKRTPFGDAIFSLIDCDNSGQLDFSEYVQAMSTFCILGQEEVLQFCFFVFDDDRNGTIEGNELSTLMSMLHQDGQSSNMKAAMEKYDFNSDGKIDFQEFQLLNAQFPTLLYPAFRMQQNMRRYTLGVKWWELKLIELKEIKNNPEATAEKEKMKKRKEKLKRLKRIARLKMGCLKYYVCPCRRSRYMIDLDDLSDDEKDEDEEARKAKEHEDGLRRLEEAKKHRKGRRSKKQKTTASGKRVPLTREERQERARKRRLRDMADRPGRK